MNDTIGTVFILLKEPLQLSTYTDTHQPHRVANVHRGREL